MAKKQRVTGPGGAGPSTRTVERVKVRATKLGYFGDRRRRPGDVFSISADPTRYDKDGTVRAPRPDEHNAEGTPFPREFSSKWMEFVHPETPEHAQTSVEAQRSANIDKVGDVELKPNAADPVDRDGPGEGAGGEM